MRTFTFEAFCWRLRDYCEQTGASVTSFGRTRLHNKAVGGVWDSRHIDWAAGDVVYDPYAGPLTPAEVRTGRDKLAADLGLRLIHEGDHDHVQEA